jgi:PadR family transcriptional regulator, regulatory protein PadR
LIATDPDVAPPEASNHGRLRDSRTPRALQTPGEAALIVPVAALGLEAHGHGVRPAADVGWPKAHRPSGMGSGLLRPCILGQLADGHALYGYDLHQRLSGIGLECDRGTVYRALNTMEADGLLRSTWECTAGGRRRRRYALSESGLAVLDSYVVDVERLMWVAQTFLDSRKPHPFDEGG